MTTISQAEPWVTRERRDAEPTPPAPIPAIFMANFLRPRWPLATAELAHLCLRINASCLFRDRSAVVPNLRFGPPVPRPRGSVQAAENLGTGPRAADRAGTLRAATTRV